MSKSSKYSVPASISILVAACICVAQQSDDKNVRVVEARISAGVRLSRQQLQEKVPESSDFIASLSPGIKSAGVYRGPTPFKQSVPGFSILCESGTEDPSVIRLQISSDQYYAGPGDGGTLDVAHQLFKLLPEQEFIAAIERKHLDGFFLRLKEWHVHPHLTIIPQELPVAQWAQDNGKGGRIRQADGTWKAVLLVPRYASRGERPTIFVPGESFIADALAEAGIEVVQSSLVFQGGNLSAVYEPSSKRTVLLIGEAEVFRNAASGWTSAQIVEAFKTEFGADECLVLPATSFHIDYEVTARSVGDHVVAFVNDPEAAHRIVLDVGLRILEAHTIVNKEMAGKIRGFVGVKDWCGAAGFLEQLIERLGGAGGQFPLEIAQWFQNGASDSGVGNFQRFLATCDYVCSHSHSGAGKNARGEFLRSLRNADSQRTIVIASLERLGWQIAYIPSTSDDELSLNYLNGVQLKDRFLMPAYGGVFGELDRAARAAFESDVPGLKVFEVLCGESQRRNGALHCSISVL